MFNDYILYLNNNVVFSCSTDNVLYSSVQYNVQLLFFLHDCIVGQRSVIIVLVLSNHQIYDLTKDDKSLQRCY